MLFVGAAKSERPRYEIVSSSLKTVALLRHGYEGDSGVDREILLALQLIGCNFKCWFIW